MGTRIALIAVRNMERVMAHFKTDACAIDTGPIGVETALSTAFHPQRIRSQPVGRRMTAARRRSATASAPAIDVVPWLMHDASPMPEPLLRLVSSNTTKNTAFCEGAVGHRRQDTGDEDHSAAASRLR
jgi:hypothetical protein